MRYKFRPGVSHSYHFDMTMNMKISMGAKSSPVNMGMSAIMKQVVKSVARDGTATVEMVPGKMNTTYNGKAMNSPMGQQKSVSLQISPTGHMSGMQMQGMNPMAGGLQNFQAVSVLPDKPVSIGSHWNSAGNFGGASFTADNTLVSIDRSGGHVYANVKTKGSGDLSKIGSAMGSSGMKGQVFVRGSYVFDVTSGLLKSMSEDVKLSMAMSMGNSGQARNIGSSGTANISMKLLQ